MKVAQPAFAAPREECLFAILVEIDNQLARFRISDDGAHRHAQGDVFAALAVTIRAATVFAPLGGKMTCEAKIDQRVEVAVSDYIDAPAAAAVAAVRTAERYELFASERRCAVAAVARGDLDARFVKEFHGVFRCGWPQGRQTKKPYRKDRAFLGVEGTLRPFWA